MLVRYSPTKARRRAAMGKLRCSICKLPVFINSTLQVSPPGLTCGPCYDGLQAKHTVDRAADLKARQARRRDLQKQLLPDLLRKHAANRAEVAKKILTFVGFDLPGE
jgi:hypothetical protein